ncbi:exonuclease domain-containing protein [Polaribacter sp.]|uniref:exonuclease domain-containing protein n=1 Tax=Polaribacter sp. TaxID=1920175 RepID=UPI002633EF83|nr:exonuclease domain-containing protein [Polaribacter sp.]MBT7816606.1 GIY-YIG nuclease family protein [Polaribacter sp.]MDG1403077.1 exonuclease domain-containing protein [Polaribacter sp.]MDG2435695.1 exonuclease domain-containing protein [Polaribacter sp.]
MLYAVVDIETTGNGYKGQKITEISALIFDGKKIVDEFTSLVNPEQNIPTFITNLTGITNAMVRNAPKFYEVAKKVEEITKGTIFVAHNVNFDYNIIQAEFKSLGYDFKRKKLCTVRLTRKIIPGLPSYSLGNICSGENISINGRHRAKGDAEATVELFRRLLERDDNFTINSFLNPRSRQATLPPLLDKIVVDKLPETFGVYYFKNLAKEVIYVGKANNIKQRVISHFYDKKKKEQTMCLETADVSFTKTGSELLALLLESSEIKHIYPKFNRAQRRAGEAVGLFSYEDQKGIIHLAYNRLKLAPNAIMKYYSVAECRTHLESLCAEFELCPKYCHLQTNVSSCFHYQLKECKGICCDKETVENYNVRVREAIKSVGIGAENLVIKEKGRTKNEVGFALILDGIYKGIGYLDASQDEVLKTPEEYQFFVAPKKDNRDVQRIIASYLKKKEKLKALENGEISI